MARISTLLLTVLIVSLAVLTACGSIPPSEELQQLEARMGEEKTQELRQIPNASRFLDEARRYRRLAREAQEDRRASRSQEYAMLGLLRYETALAIYEQFEKAEELEGVNAQIVEINPTLREVTSSRNELVQELNELNQQMAEAADQRRQRRQRELQERGDAEAAQRASSDQDSEVLERANEAITRARELREKALDHDADKYSETRGLFQRADTQLENARNLLNENPGAASRAKRQVSFAVQLFEEAYETAVPVHEAYVEKMRPENRIASIQDKAQANFGGQYTEVVPNGTKIIMAGLFPQGESEFERETGPWLNALAELIDEYEEFSVQIDGYTRRGGGTTQNLAISQSRAQRVQSFLVDAGIDSSRIRHDGHGQQDIRFSDTPRNNDRVEVTLTHSGR